MYHVIERLKKEIEGLKWDLPNLNHTVTENVINSAIESREKQLKKLELQFIAQSKVYLHVVYRGGMDIWDGLTTGKTYGVHDENETQYVVINDLGATSTITKSKFDIVGK